MKTNHITFLLSLLAIVSTKGENDTSDVTGSTSSTMQMVSVNKCCPHGQTLDISNPEHPVCFEDPDALSPFITIKGINVKSKNTVDLQLTQDTNIAISVPDCDSDFEVHQIEAVGKE